MGAVMTAWRRTDEAAGHSVARVGQVEASLLWQGTEVLAGADELSWCRFWMVVGDEQLVADAAGLATRVAGGARS